MKLRPVKNPKDLNNEDLLYEYRIAAIEVVEFLSGIDYTEKEFEMLNKIEYELAKEIFIRMCHGTKQR